jgi:choline kinase
MLSEETAIGEYPVECIAMMKLVARTVEDARRREIEAVVLSAGPSTGFGSLTTNKHKCMLDVGGSTIIAHQLENLLLAGISSENVSVVTGSNYRQIEHYLTAEGYRGSFVHNPWFQTTNMATSLWLARKDNSNLVIVYGDIVFEQSILEDLLATDGDIVCVVDRRSDLDAEDEKVILSDDRIVRASKDLDLDEAHGEFIGLVRLSRRGARKLFAELDRLVHDGDMMTFFSDVLSRLADSGMTIGTCYTNGRAWSDNDTLADLGVTRESIYPRIREARQQHQTKANSHS